MSTENRVIEGPAKPPRSSKTEKKQKNLYLSAHARQLLAVLSHDLGISETAVVELLVREKAARENIVAPARIRTPDEERPGRVVSPDDGKSRESG